MKGSSRSGTIATICLVLVALIKLQVLTGCANIIPPAGGPKDTIPPHLVSASPKDSTLNFSGNRIVLTFDEYVDLQDVQNNLLFTPTFENNPPIDVRGKTLTIRLKDTLEHNTTYIFNFGNAVKDVNEGNVLKNFTYTFSTGSHLDTATLSGKVFLAENGQVDSTLSVLLHKRRYDSAVVKERPMYIVKLDGQGNFRFHNLPNDTFAIYALATTGGGRRYNGGTQLFAFADAPVIAGKSAPVTLYAYREKAAASTGSSQQPQTGVAGTKTSGSDRRLRFTPATTETQDLGSDYVLNFPVPLRTFDSSKVSLTVDSAFQPVPYTISLDTSRKVLHLRSEWREAAKYNLVLDKTFATDTLGHQLLKTDTLNFTTKSRSDYGNLTVRLKNIDTSLNPILQFVQNGQVMYSAPVKTGVYTNNLFIPGDYDLRILYDRNNNGKWDPGQFFGVKRQPEIVHPITEKITVKAAWDNTFDRSL